MRGKLIIVISLFVVVFCASNICAQYVHPFDTFTRFENPNLDNEPQNMYDLNLLIITIPKVNQIDLGLFLTSHEIFGVTVSERQFLYQNLGLKDGNREEILDFRFSINEEQISLRKSDFASENLDQYPTFSSMNPLDERNNSFILYSEINNLPYLLDNFFELQRNTKYDNKFSLSLPSCSLKNNFTDFAFHYLNQTRKMESDHAIYLLDNYNKKKVQENPSIHNSKESNNGLYNLANLDLSSSSYPDFSFSIQNSGFVYDIFDTNSFTSIMEESSDNFSVDSQYKLSSRQRRTTFIWEMTDFSDYTSDNNNDFLDLSNLGGQDITIVIKPLLSGDVAPNDDVNESATQGVASNMPVYLNSGIWDPGTRTYENFMKITGQQPNSVTIDASAVKYYMNWYYGDWGYDGIGPNYDLVYYSAVPEPSTYFMTGILLCLIGCSRQSRQSIKLLWLKALPNQSEKGNISKVKNRLS